MSLLVGTIVGMNRLHGIRVSGLTKDYGGVRAVRGVDLRVAAGESVALLGPNGAGKSTTIDMILGLTAPDGGTVSVFGAAPKEAVRAGRVGGMLQSGSPLEFLRVRELVALTASYYPHPLPVGEALALAGADAFADQWASNLSGGQIQRVRFAGAIVGDPDLLVLDEPTAALDVEGRNDFWRAIGDVTERGTTVLFATHYLEEADAHADRIVLMAHGRVIVDGPATEIKARVGSRTIRATLPGVGTAGLGALPGVTTATRQGDAITLVCNDSDTVLRHLLSGFPAVRDLEVRGGSLEEAFLELTADDSLEVAR